MTPSSEPKSKGTYRITIMSIGLHNYDVLLFFLPNWWPKRQY